MSERYGLLGERLGHSYSPLIHSYFGGYGYSLFELESGEVENFIKNGEWSGLNVTIPYKKTVMDLVDVLDEKAVRIGAVNTLVRRGGKIYGYNTDYSGFSGMLDSNSILPEGKKCLVLGSGGACATVKTVLNDRGASSVTVISRSGEDNYANISRHYDADIIINTTPVGMYPDNLHSPLSLDGFCRLEALVDLIYNPNVTALMYEAQRRGIKTVGGLEMLVEQAAASAGLFGVYKNDDKGYLRKMIREVEAKMLNIILIGMPSCGKTTVGRELASLTGRRFIDCDGYIEEKYGSSPADIIKNRGEDAFRRIESEALRELCKGSSCIVACGGGAVVREENYLTLKQNGRIFCIRRDLSALITTDRPLSEQKGIEKLYAERKDKYERFADHGVDFTSAEECAKRIIEIYENSRA